MINNFDSVESFAKAAKVKPWKHASSGTSWDNHIGHDKASELATIGDEQFVGRAEELLEKIEGSVETPHSEWLPSIYGAFPIVPEFLAGSPTSMRHRTQVPSDASPMAIWVDLTCSGGFSSEEMEKRGVAILALVMKLQAIRPVELYLVACVDQLDGGLVIKVESQPLNLSTAGFALCAVSFVRHLGYGYMDYKPYYTPISDASVIRRKLNTPENDLIIPGGYITDRTIVDNPVEWVNQKVKEYAKVEDEY